MVTDGCDGRAPTNPRPMRPWLVGNCDLFGVACQNWMWLTAGALRVYVVTLVIAKRRPRAH
jgi:hypothetical protein